MDKHTLETICYMGVNNSQLICEYADDLIKEIAFNEKELKSLWDDEYPGLKPTKYKVTITAEEVEK